MRPARGPVRIKMIDAGTGARGVMHQHGAGDDGVLEIDAWLPPQWRDPWRHLHPLQEERVRVRRGCVVAEIGGWSRTYSAGETFIIPPGIDHALSVPGTEATHIVMEVTPPLRTADLIKDLQRPAMAKLVARSGWPKTLAAAIMARDFAQELELVEPPLYLGPRMVGVLVTLARLLGYGKPRSGVEFLELQKPIRKEPHKNPRGG